MTLPRTINARLNTINDACTRAEFEADIGKCAHAKAGTAVASTPLLRDPLRGQRVLRQERACDPGSVRRVARPGRLRPDRDESAIPGGKHLATTFATAPDVPIRSFTLRLLGGPSTASIGAAENLCSSAEQTREAAVDYIGQNGKVCQVDQALKVGGCAKHARGRHRRH